MGLGVLEGQRILPFQENPSDPASHHVRVNQHHLAHPVGRDDQTLLSLLFCLAFQASLEWTDRWVLGVLGAPEVQEGLLHLEAHLVPLAPVHLAVL